MKTYHYLKKKAIKLLESWTGNYDKEEIGPVIYSRWVYEFQKSTFADEMKSGFQQFTNTHLAEKVLPVQAERTESIWWDDISTENKVENKSDIVNTSFRNAYTFLEHQLGGDVEHWTWDKVISVEHKHALGEVDWLRPFFNVGPFQTSGGDQVINNQIYDIDSTGYYKVKAGPSTRRIVDFSDVENSLAILPTGQSGRIFSPYYKDQAQRYLRGGFIKMIIDSSEVKKSSNVLIIKPGEN